VKKFHPATIVIGYNHQFGHHRDWNIELLRKLADQNNFRVEEIHKQIVDDIEVSSTRIRIALQEGDVKTASHLLGYFYSLSGTVTKGNQLGRKLGFPTANIIPDDKYNHPLMECMRSGLFLETKIKMSNEHRHASYSQWNIPHD
jgi:FAD synthase